MGELRLEKLRERIISLAVTLALEKHDNHREMTSQLISGLYGEVYTQAHVTKAFDDLLDNLNDLTLDTPDAPKVCHWQTSCPKLIAQIQVFSWVEGGGG